MDPLPFVIIMYAAYLVFAFLMAKRLLSIMAALPLLSMILGIAAGLSTDKILNIAVQGSQYYVVFYLTIAMGGVFGMAIVETGISESIVKRAVELAGERRGWVMAAIYLSYTYLSIGGVSFIVVGYIVVPIMMTLGVAPWYITNGWLGGYQTALPMWAGHWSNFKVLTGLYSPDIPGYITMAIIMIGICTFYNLLYHYYEEHRISFLPGSGKGFGAHWATPIEPEKEAAAPTTGKLAPVYTYVAVAIPVIFMLVLGWSPIIAFPVALPIVYLFALPSRRFRTWKEISTSVEKCWYIGLQNVKEAFMIHVVLGWLVYLSTIPEVKALLVAVLGPILPYNKITFILFWAIMMPMGMFRGPATPWGLGAVLITTAIAGGKLPPLAVLGATWCLNLFAGWADPFWGDKVWCNAFVKGDPITQGKRVFPFAYACGLTVLLAVTLLPPFGDVIPW